MIVKEIYFRWRQCTPSEDPYKVNTPPQTGAIPGSYRFFFSLRNVHSSPKNRQFSHVCECGDNKHLFLLLKPISLAPSMNQRVNTIITSSEDSVFRFRLARLTGS